MSLKFFTVSIHDASAMEAELNQFLNSWRILSVERRFVDLGVSSFWAICVDYLPVQSGNTSASPDKKARVDFREVLAPEEFGRFVQLRDLRKRLAQAEAVPVYTIFTNEQLADMVRQNVRNLAELGRIQGIGEARVAKYGPAFLTILQALGDNDETLRSTV